MMVSGSDAGDALEMLRRASRTGTQVSGEIIIDRKRVSELANELIASRHKEIEVASDGITSEGVSENSMPNKTMSDKTMSEKAMPEKAMPEKTIVESTSGPEITGIQIGAGQVAEFSSLEEYRSEICECQKCPLGATRTKFVFGVGSPTADLMFVGEAPGKNEDLQGEPFVGRGGQLLDKILGAIKLTRSEIYIANILKCRPPGNRDPQPEEMEHCFPYLKEQIAIVKPKLICSLGRISAQALLQTKLPLGKMRNQWHSYQGIPLRVTYHPAALLRNPNFKRGCWEDMQIVEAEYKRLTS